MTEKIIKKKLEKLHDILFRLGIGKPSYHITFHATFPILTGETYDEEITDQEMLTLYESIITRKINTLEEILTKIKG